MEKMLHFEVLGYTWEGQLCAYQYSQALAGAEPTKAKARALRDSLISGEGRKLGDWTAPDMGDFQSLADVRIVLTRHSYERAGALSRRTDESATLAGFADSHSARTYALCTYGR